MAGRDNNVLCGGVTRRENEGRTECVAADVSFWIGKKNAPNLQPYARMRAQREVASVNLSILSHATAPSKPINHVVL